MKREILALFLILTLPCVFAQDKILEAKKVTLDYNSDVYLTKFDALVEFLTQKNISTESLILFKQNFLTKKEEAMKANDVQEFQKAYIGMKDISNEVRKEAKILCKNNLIEAKLATMAADKKANLTEKKKVVAEAKKSALVFALDNKINSIKLKIGNDKKEGKSAKLNELLLDKFEKENEKIKNTNTADSRFKINSDDVTKVASKTSGVLATLKEFFSGIIADIEAQEHE